MLVDPKFNETDELFKMLFGDEKPKRIEQGIYEIDHFNSDHLLDDKWEIYPELPNINSYGVCDNYEQVLEAEPVLKESDRKYVLFVTEVAKKNQPECGGWRWHKWGPYIGNYNRTQEYLYDEPEIEKVYVYHVHEYIGEG